VPKVFAVDLGVSQSEKILIDKISISRDLQHDYYGGDSVELKSGIVKCLSEIGSNTIEQREAVASVIDTSFRKMLISDRADSAWVTVRVFLPDTSVYTPRWHRDGQYFSSEHKVYKLVQTLIGEKTRFAEIIDNDLFNQLESEQITEELSIEKDIQIRKDLDSAVNEIFPTLSRWEAVKFIVGTKNAVVHSEPPTSKPRLFYSVLAGTKKQIAEWQNR